MTDVTVQDPPTMEPTPPVVATAGPQAERRLSLPTGRRLLRMYLTELRLVLREPQVLVFVFGFPVITVLVLSGVFGTGTDDSGFEFINPSHYYASAYFGVVLSAIGLIMLPAHIAGYRHLGVLRRYRTSGIAPWVFPAVQFLTGLTMAVLGFVVLTATALLGSGMPEMADVGRTLAGLAVGTLAFISIGIALGLLYPSPRAAQGLGLTMFFPMFLLAGGGPPPEALTDGMRVVADWMPLTHVIRSAQEPWLGLGSGGDHLAIITAILAASTMLWLWRAASVSRTA